MKTLVVTLLHNADSTEESVIGAAVGLDACVLHRNTTELQGNAAGLSPDICVVSDGDGAQDG